MKRRRDALARPLAILGILLATACSGGGGSVEGQIYDTLIENLDYEAGLASGTTGAAGAFLVSEASMITFLVGDIALPEVAPATVVTPVEMVAAATDETNATVQQIARFFLTLDADEDPSNGIVIPDAAHIAATGHAGVTWSSAASVDAALDVLTPNDPVTATYAEVHLRDTLLCLVGGVWSGEYTSAPLVESGTWNATINPLDGLLVMGGGDGGGFTFASGMVETDGDADFVEGDGSVWDGVFTRTGKASGTWTRGGGSGTFSGALMTPADCTVGIPDDA